MAKELRCGDVMPGCDFGGERGDGGGSAEESRQHARDKHNVTPTAAPIWW